MTATFPQYCTVCEKQINNPCVSILYCSAKCRRKDANKPLTESLEGTSPPPSSFLFPTDDDDDSIVPRMSPTLPPSRGSSCISLIDAENEAMAGATTTYRPPSSSSSTASFRTSSHDDLRHHPSLLSKTKNFPYLPVSPVRTRSDFTSNRLHQGSQDSEAAKYLRQFHASSSSSTPRAYQTRPTTASRGMTTPSLHTTPLLIDLDTSGTNSPDGTPPSRTTTIASAPHYFPYIVNEYTRPLPPRTNPMYTTSTNNFFASTHKLTLSSTPFVPKERVSALSVSLIKQAELERKRQQMQQDLEQEQQSTHAQSQVQSQIQATQALLLPKKRSSFPGFKAPASVSMDSRQAAVLPATTIAKCFQPGTGGKNRLSAASELSSSAGSCYKEAGRVQSRFAVRDMQASPST